MDVKLHRSTLYNQLHYEFISAIKTSEINFNYILYDRLSPFPLYEAITTWEEVSAATELSGYFANRIFP